MICKVYRHWRMAQGQRVRDRYYTGHLKIDGDAKISYIRLNTTDKVVAQKKLNDLCADRERERIGILAPKALRSAADLPIAEHLKAYLADLKANKCATGYVSCVDHRINALLRQCGWTYLRDINADRFVTWRSAQTYASKTLNDYLNAISALELARAYGSVGGQSA